MTQTSMVPFPLFLFLIGVILLEVEELPVLQSASELLSALEQQLFSPVLHILLRHHRRHNHHQVS